jgi:hypothetical protein
MNSLFGHRDLHQCETEHKSVQCFLGIRAEQLERVVENRELGNRDTVLIHIGTNDLRRNVNLDYVMGEVYDLMNTAKSVFQKSKLILSGVLRHQDVYGVIWVHKMTDLMGY